VLIYLIYIYTLMLIYIIIIVVMKTLHVSLFAARYNGKIVLSCESHNPFVVPAYVQFPMRPLFR
jgi:hypothetical protein